MGSRGRPPRCAALAGRIPRKFYFSKRRRPEFDASTVLTRKDETAHQRKSPTHRPFPKTVRGVFARGAVYRRPWRLPRENPWRTRHHSTSLDPCEKGKKGHDPSTRGPLHTPMCRDGKYDGTTTTPFLPVVSTRTPAVQPSVIWTKKGIACGELNLCKGVRSDDDRAQPPEGSPKRGIRPRSSEPQRVSAVIDFCFSRRKERSPRLNLNSHGMGGVEGQSNHRRRLSVSTHRRSTSRQQDKVALVTSIPGRCGSGPLQ